MLSAVVRSHCNSSSLYYTAISCSVFFLGVSGSPFCDFILELVLSLRKLLSNAGTH